MFLNDTPLFDAHFHIIDPQFPLQANQGFVPEPFTCDDYLQRMNGQTLTGGVVVSGSFQGFDQDYLLAALKQLGPGYVGVTQLPPTAGNATLKLLNAAGVRGVRFNLYRGGMDAAKEMVPFAQRIHELFGWHAEIYADAPLVDRLYPEISQLPKVAIDHLALSRIASSHLLDLVAQGVRVKASGFGRLEVNPIPLLRELYAANPASLMFGTDLPSTRAPRPYSERDLQRIGDAFCEKGVRRVLCDNARQFYGLAD
jgi:predicted TIM-barrel fold metal-dependent hydrolase